MANLETMAAPIPDDAPVTRIDFEVAMVTFLP
jgi:hypothetical protein